jgi:hypothetical protein
MRKYQVKKEKQKMGKKKLDKGNFAVRVSEKNEA